MPFARCLIVCPAHKLSVMQSYFIEYPEQAMDLNMNATCVVPSPVIAGKVLYILLSKDMVVHNLEFLTFSAKNEGRSGQPC